MLCRIVEGDDMSFWKSGDRAIISNNATARHEDELLIQGVPGSSCTLRKYIGQGVYTKNTWAVILENGRDIWVSEKALRKPYDGNELCEWSAVCWQPKELLVVN